MPELPEVETTRRGLEPAMLGTSFTSVVQRRANLRFAFPDHFSNRLTGTKVTSLDRRAKYIVAPLSSGEALVMHLGMSGSFAVYKPEEKVREPALHDHVVFHFSNGFTVVYNDPPRVGFIDSVRTQQQKTSPQFI